MRRIVSTLAVAGAILTGFSAYWILRPNGPFDLYYASHQELERLAFSDKGSEALKKAVLEQRLAMKSIAVSRGMARGLIASSVLLVGLAVLVSALPDSSKNKTARPMAPSP